MTARTPVLAAQGRIPALPALAGGGARVASPASLRRRPLIRSVIRATAEVCGVKHRDFMRQDRHRSIAWPRQVAMLAAREFTGKSYPTLGRAFGLDHSTIIYGIRAARARPDTAVILAAVRARLGLPT